MRPARRKGPRQSPRTAALCTSGRSAPNAFHGLPAPTEQRAERPDPGSSAGFGARATRGATLRVVRREEATIWVPVVNDDPVFGSPLPNAGFAVGRLTGRGPARGVGEASPAARQEAAIWVLVVNDDPVFGSPLGKLLRPTRNCSRLVNVTLGLHRTGTIATSRACMRPRRQQIIVPLRPRVDPLTQLPGMIQGNELIDALERPLHQRQP